jgi:FecR, C-terminal
MRLPQFTIRDLLWITIVVALGLSWWADNKRIEKAVMRIEQDRHELQADFQDRMTILDEGQKKLRVSLAGERAKAALEEPTTLTVRNMPLKDVAAYFSQAHKVNFAIHAGLPTDVPITGTVQGQKLRDALEILLPPSRLTYSADGDQIVIGPNLAAK